MSITREERDGLQDLEAVVFVQILIDLVAEFKGQIGELSQARAGECSHNCGTERYFRFGCLAGRYYAG